VNKGQVVGRYSRLLINTFDIADIPGVIDRLKVFLKLISTDRKLKTLFSSRAFSEDEKAAALKIIQSHLKASEQFGKFLGLIINQGHLPVMKEIIKSSITAYNERLKKMTALVISPVVIEKTHIERLRSTLKVLTRREIDVETQIDPSLLGGFIVKVGSTIYDSSLKGQLRLMKAELMK